MVSADAGRYKSPRHFVHFGRYENIIRFNVTAGRQCEVNSRGETPDMRGVTSPTHHKPSRARRPRSRYGYDHHWWGESPPVEPEDPSYWSTTRKPLPGLTFILPILLAYEAGVIWLGGPSADALRAGADAWVRQGLAALGFTDRWILPVGLIGGLLAWQAVDRRDWRFHPAILWGMAVESLLLAVALVGLSKLVDLGFSRLEGSSLLATSSATRHPIAPVIGFLGAGLYEEALFRLALIPLMYRGLRLMLVPSFFALTLAVTASSLIFSLAHHAGVPGEPFTWFAFIFRWLAGVFFAWVFVVRGFGVAVGTHTAYDLLVGWLDWHL
jgi:Type II CAAX prenyl endopeptidase Rce1-like